MQSKNNEILYTVIIGSVFLLLIGTFSIILLLLHIRKQKKNHLEKVDLRNRFEAALLKTELEIQEFTLNHIGTEIHSNIVQVLYFAQLQIVQLPDIITQTHRDEIYDLLKKVSDDLRTISHSLNENRFHQIGLNESLKQLIFSIEKTGKYKIDWVIEDEIDLDTLSLQSDLILFRIIQEIIHNILKHAKASSINLRMYAMNKTIVLEISDDGIGFDFSLTQAANKGIGINNILSRSKLINATANIYSSKGNGTVVTLFINPTNP